ncbi:alpha/beta hydrolase family protein [Fictibacillus aquaticus]|nr:alpha/beta fold hydrolase [Fictibacillus aquaticus]
MTAFPHKRLHAIGETKNKTVLMYHGWGSTIETQMLLAERLAQAGFDVILPEIIYHDTRSPLDDHFEKAIMQTYFWKTIFESIDEMNELLSVLNLSKEDTILYGSSMGGFIASGIFFKQSGFAGIVNVNGSSSFVTSETIFRDRDGRHPLSDDELALFKSYDPKYCSRDEVAPVLFLHGLEDGVVPIAGQEDFYSHSPRKDSVLFLKYEGINHSISEDMAKDILDWFKTNF